MFKYFPQESRICLVLENVIPGLDDVNAKGDNEVTHTIKGHAHAKDNTLDLFSGSLDPELLKNLFGATASGDFMRTCAIFALAAFVHARQVRKEIKAQFALLVSVLQADLEAQKKNVGMLAERIDKIEVRLQLKE